MYGVWFWEIAGLYKLPLCAAVVLFWIFAVSVIDGCVYRWRTSFIDKPRFMSTA